MTEVETTGESKDGTGAGDHDTPYRPEAHGVLLSWREHLQCLLLRGRIKDRRDARDFEPDDNA